MHIKRSCYIPPKSLYLDPVNRIYRWLPLNNPKRRTRCRIRRLFQTCPGRAVDWWSVYCSADCFEGHWSTCSTEDGPWDWRGKGVCGTERLWTRGTPPYSICACCFIRYVDRNWVMYTRYSSLQVMGWIFAIEFTQILNIMVNWSFLLPIYASIIINFQLSLNIC